MFSKNMSISNTIWPLSLSSNFGTNSRPHTRSLSQDLAKPYDPKKSCWFPLKEGGYAEGIIEATEGDKVMKSPSHGGEIQIVGIADKRVCQGVKSILIRSLLSHRWWFALMVRRKY